jgi:hypothetical protein
MFYTFIFIEKANVLKGKIFFNYWKINLIFLETIMNKKGILLLKKYFFFNNLIFLFLKNFLAKEYKGFFFIIFI